jgi:hypothetical protein
MLYGPHNGNQVDAAKPWSGIPETLEWQLATSRASVENSNIRSMPLSATTELGFIIGWPSFCYKGAKPSGSRIRETSNLLQDYHGGEIQLVAAFSAVCGGVTWAIGSETNVVAGGATSRNDLSES